VAVTRALKRCMKNGASDGDKRDFNYERVHGRACDSDHRVAGGGCSAYRSIQTRSSSNSCPVTHRRPSFSTMRCYTLADFTRNFRRTRLPTVLQAICTQIHQLCLYPRLLHLSRTVLGLEFCRCSLLLWSTIVAVPARPFKVPLPPSPPPPTPPLPPRGLSAVIPFRFRVGLCRDVVNVIVMLII
jgi:hypothetical protein